MPRFKPIVKLERSALADFCRHTLSHIPTVSGQLVYLAGLRDVNSGTYKHHGLADAFGRDEAARALRESHHTVFSSWLSLSLAEKDRDLRDYLVLLDDPQEQVVAHWLHSGVFRSYVPPSAGVLETELFCTEWQTLLQLHHNEFVRRRQRSAPAPGDDMLDQDSSRPA